MNIREIREEDNLSIAEVIGSVLIEFRADPHTTFLGDPLRHNMFQNYREPGTIYYVAEIGHKIVGGCGIGMLEGSSENTCELQRMFLLPEARGLGYGKELIDLCICKAKEFKYDQVYLESLSQMQGAIHLYDKTGFKRINGPLGKTGHGGCDVFMLLAF